MKKRLVCIGLALALLAGLSLTAAAEDLELPAPSCILMEKQTGQVLYESNAHEKLRPASVTKVMKKVFSNFLKKNLETDN